MKLPARGVPAREAEVVIGFKDDCATEDLRVSVNGVEQNAAAASVPLDYRYPACSRVIVWSVDRKDLRPGMNAISLSDAGNRIVQWCEIRFRNPAER